MNVSIVRSALVAAVLAAVGACQIFGERARCNKLDEPRVHACAGDEQCGEDGFCAKKPPAEACVQKPLPASKSVHVTIAGTVGVEAMGDQLFQLPPVIVADAHGCNVDTHSGCGGQNGNPSGTQPLGALAVISNDVRSTVLSTQSIKFPAPQGFDYHAGFSFEAVFKTPKQAPVTTATSPLSAIVSMSSTAGQGSDGWILGVDANDVVTLRVGGFDTALAAPSDATWHHVVCSVDVPGLLQAQTPDDILCAVDGHLAPPAQPGDDTSTIGFTPHDLVLGGAGATSTLDGAEVAVVRVWSSGRPEPGIRTIDREDALLDEERARLMRYVGLHVDLAPPRFLVTNFGDVARAQPVLKQFELVAGGWPRVVNAKDGSRGLLLEPARANRLKVTVLNCKNAGAADGALSPDGRADACHYDGVPSTQLPTSPVNQVIEGGRAPDFGPGSPFVLTGFLRMPPGVTNDGAQLHFHVEGATGGTFEISADCNLARDVDGSAILVGSDPDHPDGCQIERLGDWVRLTSRMTDIGNLTVDLFAHGDVWSPQLELGVDPTTPMAFDPVNPALGRDFDEVVIEAPGLANASSTALRANVVTDGQALSMQPLFVADDADVTDRVVRLEVTPSPLGGVLSRIEVTEKGTADTNSGEIAWHPGQHIKLGADLGAPIDPCRECDGGPLNAFLPANEQWENVGMQGFGEPGIMANAEVLTSGDGPLPLALDVQADLPQPGCLEGATPDVALLACAQGACAETSPVAWEGTPRAIAQGPSVGERAVSGSFTAKVSDASPLDELYLEVRFAPSGADGTVVEVKDALGTVIAVKAESGDAVLVDAAGGIALRLLQVWSTPDEWTQLSCWIGLQPRCVLNADTPQDLQAPIDIGGRKMTTVTVGGGANQLAFARLWRERAEPKREVDRILGARVASSFGFLSQPRRAGFDMIEVRKQPGVIGKGGVFFQVGKHWPRIVDDGGPLYVAESGEGLTIITRDLSDFAHTTVELAFANAPGGTLIELAAPPAESLTLARDGSKLDVVHDTGAPPTPASLDGLDQHTLVFGARGDVLTLEGVDSPPAMIAVDAPASEVPMTEAHINATADNPVKLRHVRLGTR